MPVQRNGRQCLLQMRCQHRAKFRACGDQLCLLLFAQAARLLEAFHQFTHNVLGICRRTAVARNEQLAAGFVAGAQKLAGPFDIRPQCFQQRIAPHQKIQLFFCAAFRRSFGVHPHVSSLSPHSSCTNSSSEGTVQSCPQSGASAAPNNAV